MKKILRKAVVASLVTVMVSGIVTTAVSAENNSGDVIVLYTNDVHCAIDNYDELAGYRAQLIQDGYTVITVDAGDAIQGEAIGSLTEGSAIVDLMNAVEYDYAVPGNHEFDYTTDTFLSLANEQAEFEYLCTNFVDLRTDATVFKPYEIVELNGEKVAFLGIATPETYTKSTPTYFQDDDGNYIYSFSESEFYNVIQTAVDNAKNEGAERIVAIGHLGISGTTDGWKSTDVIANTVGIDVFLDAHTHEVIPESTYTNKNGEEVILSSTGTKFEYFGQLTLNDDGTEETELIKPENVDVDSLSDEAKEAYTSVHEKIDDYNEETAYLNEVIGNSEVELTLNNPDTGDWVIRTAETNMGDYVADAYRQRTGADIALVNSGGIRKSVDAGEVTRKELMDVNPWNNEMCVINATGQQILDALEHGARLYPEACGGFLQVSGLTYDIHAWVESPVVTDDSGSFVSVDNTKERRVANVKINGEPVDPQKNYTVTGSYYTLKQGGDGFTMFADCEVVKSEGLETDAEMLIQYLVEDLGGIVTAEQYGNLLGDDRINIYANQSDIPAEENPDEEEPTEPSSTQSATEPTEKTTQNATENATTKTVTTTTTTTQSSTVPETGDTTTVFALFTVEIISLALTFGIISRRKKNNN